MRRLGVVLLAVGLLSGCSGGEAVPAGSAPVDRSWPPPSVLAIDEPSLPPIDAKPTKVTALAYARYLIDEIDYALRTTFPDSVLQRGTDEWGRRCQVCDEVVELAVSAREKRQRYEFEDWSGYALVVRELEPEQPGDPATYWRLRLLLSQPEMQVLDGRGEVVDTTPPRERETLLVIGMRDGGWRVFAWDVLETGASA